MNVGAYIFKKYAKPAYRVECYNARHWPGFEMILQAVRQAGHTVEFCTADTVHLFDAVLVSITATCDWYPFIRERTQWRKGDYITIVGGAGVMNIRPVLWTADVFVFGRGESVISDILAAHSRAQAITRPNFCYTHSFKPYRVYRFGTVDRLHPDPVPLGHGKVWREKSIGCRKNCAFCAYTWTTRHAGEPYTEAAYNELLAHGSTEVTIWSIDFDDPKAIKWVRNIGLDGSSQRLRYLVNKPISRRLWRRLLRHIGTHGARGQLRIYNLVGLPTETDHDWRELLDDIQAVDADLQPRAKPQTISIHNTPFKAMPATPAAYWPMAVRNYRHPTAPTGHAFGRALRTDSAKGGATIWTGKALRLAENGAVESLAQVLSEALILRGTENDTDILRSLATSSAFINADTASKIVTLEHHTDVGRLMNEYTKRTLPTRYLQPVTGWDTADRIGARLWRKYAEPYQWEGMAIA